jgi:hypothetical protein
MYDKEYPEGGCPPYITIYYTGQSICKEQCDIVWNHVDFSVLLSALTALPRLRQVAVHFQVTPDEYDWLEHSYFLGLMSTSEKSYEHHFLVVLNAIQSARQSGISIDTISLWGFDPLYHSSNPQINPDLSTLSVYLRELLDHIQILRLGHSESALELISHCPLRLSQLNMCYVKVQHTALKASLKTNKDSIRSISFHKVNTTESNSWSSTKLSSSMLCTLLNLPQSTPCGADYCRCSRWQMEGQRLLLDRDNSQWSTRTLAKRKFTEI